MKKKKDPFEEMFGKKPKKGYKFTHVDVTVTDNDCFKGFDIEWFASGIGFGHVWYGWGLDMNRLKYYPQQQGFYADTEHMSEEFVQALLKVAAPKIAELIVKHDRK